MPEVCPRCDGMGMRVVERPDGRRLAEECDCVDMRKLAYKLDQCRIPPAFQALTLESYELAIAGSHKSLRDAHFIAKRFADDYPAMMAIGRGLMFTGRPGLGKTGLAVGVLKVLVQEKRCQGLFCDFQVLLKEIQGSWNPLTSTTELKVLEPVFNAEILVLDDLGSVKPTDWVWDTVAMILNTRYSQKRTTIITTNYENLPAGAKGASFTLGDRIGDRMRSRLLEMCRELKMDGPDYRESLADQENNHNSVIARRR